MLTSSLFRRNSMLRSSWRLAALPLCWLAAPTCILADEPVTATVSSSLATASGQIRQLAFDGDPDSFFLADKAGTSDHFTLAFDKPVAMRSIAATAGRPDGSDRLDAGTLEVSADGASFEELAA